MKQVYNFTVNDYWAKNPTFGAIKLMEKGPFSSNVTIFMLPQ